MWNTAGQRWEKPLEDRMAMSSLGGSDSRVASGCIVTIVYKQIINIKYNY